MKTYRENEQWHVQVKAAVNVLKIGQNDEEDITIQGKIKDTAFEWKLTDTAKKHYEFVPIEDHGIEEWSPETPGAVSGGIANAARG